MARKFVVSLISTFIVSLIVSFILYTPPSEIPPNVTPYSGTYFSAVPILLPVVGLAFLLGGIPVSLWLDKSVESGVIKLFSYLAAGFAGGMLTILLFTLSLGPPAAGYTITFRTIGNGVPFGLFGSMGALIFYMTEHFLQLVKKKEVN